MRVKGRQHTSQSLMTVCMPSVSSKATAVRCPQKQHCTSVPHITPQPYFTSPEFPAQAWWAFLDLIVPDYGHCDRANRKGQPQPAVPKRFAQSFPTLTYCPTLLFRNSYASAVVFSSVRRPYPNSTPPDLKPKRKQMNTSPCHRRESRGVLW